MRSSEHLLLLLTLRSALAVESAAASVSHAISEWALVWVLLSDSQLPWQLGLMLAWQSRWPSVSLLLWASPLE